MVRIPLFLSSLESGSVRPLIYGKTAKPLSEFEGSAHLKNIPTIVTIDVYRKSTHTDR